MMMKKILMMASLAAMFAVGSAQAQINYSEDFEGAGTLDDDLGWDKYEPASLGYGPSAFLGSNVALQPAGNDIHHYQTGGSIDAVTTIRADIWADDLYNVSGGESGIGLDSTGNWQTPFLFGPGSNPANAGYPSPGSGGWVVTDAMNGTGRINLTDGGAPGVGNRFMGGVDEALTLQIVIDQNTDLITVDLLNRASQLPINPTFVIPLTAAGKVNLQSMTDVVMVFFDVHTQGLKEVDNLSVVSIPEPATMVLLGLGGLAALRRRRA
jgi:hypothetical protein